MLASWITAQEFLSILMNWLIVHPHPHLNPVSQPDLRVLSHTIYFALLHGQFSAFQLNFIQYLYACDQYISLHDFMLVQVSETSAVSYQSCGNRTASCCRQRGYCRWLWRPLECLLSSVSQEARRWCCKMLLGDRNLNSFMLKRDHKHMAYIRHHD